MLGYHIDEISQSLEEWQSRVHPDDLESCYADITAHLQHVPFCGLAVAVYLYLCSADGHGTDNHMGYFNSCVFHCSRCGILDSPQVVTSSINGTLSLLPAHGELFYAALKIRL